jgi:glycosyltransferase involved in cell wall biosynthesis
VKAPSIAIFSGSHLCHNPRIIKEATTLAGAGYQVEIIGGWFDGVLKARDIELLAHIPNVKYTPVLDLTESNTVQRFICRARTKIGQTIHSQLGFENTWQLGYFAPSLRRAAKKSDADLLIAHSEPSMAAVAFAAARHGQSAGVDMEDWFSEDLSPDARKYRPVRLLRSLENALLGWAYSSCPSEAMSNALANELNCRPPAVIYNAFSWSERKSLDGDFRDRKNLRTPSIHWYSQTLGQGRGLEDLFGALGHLLCDVEIHLRGNPVAGFDRWLSERVPPEWLSKIFIHGLVENHELLSRIAEHDIGFAGEMKFCRSRDLTVTNKILQYLLAGLAVVASDTTGQKEVAAQADGAVRIYRSGDPAALAKELNLLLTSPGELARSKAAALAAAKETFCWERQAPRLLEEVERAIAA